MALQAVALRNDITVSTSSSDSDYIDSDDDRVDDDSLPELVSDDDNSVSDDETADASDSDSDYIDSE